MPSTKEKLKLFNLRMAPFLLFGMVLGIVLANNKSIWLMLLLIAIILCIIVGFIMFLDNPKYIIILFVIAALSGGISLNITNYTYTKQVGKSIDETVISARVKGVSYIFKDDQYTDNATSIIVDNILVNGKRYKKEAIIEGPTSEATFFVGQQIKVIGDLDVLEVDANNSYSIKLFNDNIYYKIEAKAIHAVDKFDIKLAEKIRSSIYHNLHKNMDHRVAGFCYSMLFGDKTYLYPYDKANFQKVGTAHIFAVSGLHVGVFCAVVLYILKLCKTKSKTNLIVVSLVLFAYAWLSSFSPSVVRASCMVIIALFAKTIGRRNDILSTLSITAFMLLLIKPYWLYDISFLLSFSAVFGIVLLYKPIFKILNKIKFLSKPASVNLAVNVGILPFSLLFFGNFSLLTLPINLIIIPLVSITYILSILHLLLNSLIPFVLIFGKISELLALFCLNLTAQTASIDWAVVSISLSLTVFIPYYAIMLSLSEYSLIKKGNKLIILMSSIVCCGIFFLCGSFI